MLASSTLVFVKKRRASKTKPRIVVVIPAYKVTNHILSVISEIPNSVEKIIVVDDCCPEETGNFIINNTMDDRVEVIRNERNLGVGGAVKQGYRRALELDCDIVVKVDGDGQMDGKMIPCLIRPIIDGKSDYAKGNRFLSVQSLHGMPKLRILGNGVLSLLTKISSGYWSIFDPTNGFTAISIKALRNLPLEKIDNGYFFETDMLFRLNLNRSVVTDVPMDARYGSETSNLKIRRIVIPFLVLHTRNAIKRYLYNYVLRDVSIASVELPLGILLLLTGFYRGIVSWLEASSLGVSSSPGNVVLTSLLILSGMQLVLAFVAFDIQNSPKQT